MLLPKIRLRVEYNFCVYIEQKKRVDLYLSALFENFSRSYIQAMIDSKKVFVNSEVITKNIKIKPQDQICILVTNEHIDLAAENIPLDIIYEDENILVINKEPNFNVHPVPGV